MPKVVCPCGFLVDKGERCDCRQRAAVARQAANDQARGTPAERGYDKDWFRLRHHYLEAHPLCCVCSAKATHVDHIKSIKEAPHLRLVESNLRAMCGPCHSRRTARDQSANWGKK